MKYARWREKQVPGAIEPTMRLALCRGRAGTGAEFGAVQYWMKSRLSREEADRIALAIEEKARALGYTILPDPESC